MNRLEIYEVNRGSPSFRLNSIELEIETVIREMIQPEPLNKQTILHILTKKYKESDIICVIKHSKGIWCDRSDMVHYREWVYPDVEMDVGV